MPWIPDIRRGATATNLFCCRGPRFGNDCRLRSGVRFAALTLAAYQFVDAGLHLFRAVDVEAQVGNVALAGPLEQLVADVAAGVHERGQCFLFLFGVVAVDGNVDQCRLAAGIQRDLANVGEGDTRVRELALYHGSDFIAKGPGNPVLVVLARPLLWHGSTPDNSLNYQKCAGDFGPGYVQ